MIEALITVIMFFVVFMVCLLMDVLFQWINKNEQGSIFYKGGKNDRSV